MTRRTYLALAKALHDANPVLIPDIVTHDASKVIVSAYRLQWQNDCAVVADALHDENPSFDVSRFLRDCGVQS